MHEPHMEIRRDPLDPVMKEAVRHRSVQQRGGYASMNHPVIPLKEILRLESRRDAAAFGGAE